jgi:hypothetical protein
VTCCHCANGHWLHPRNAYMHSDVIESTNGNYGAVVRLRRKMVQLQMMRDIGGLATG